jgi:hypothetical protein
MYRSVNQAAGTKLLFATTHHGIYGTYTAESYTRGVAEPDQEPELQKAGAARSRSSI